jgi:hypothetical protein
MLTPIRRFLLLTGVLTLLLPTMQTDRGRLSASPGNCSCQVWASGYQYPGSFVGHRSGNSGNPNVPNNVTCASSYCQTLAWTVGSAACDQYNLNNGVGYVTLDWFWSFTGQPTDYGQLHQQYDCDDI